jgi:hypothetical protein
LCSEEKSEEEPLTQSKLSEREDRQTGATRRCALVATRVRSYELEIVTGHSEDEGASRAELTLRSEQGEVLGNIEFYEPEATLRSDFVNRGGNPIMHLHTDMLSSVLALLHSEKPVFVEYTDQAGGRLTTWE